MGNNMQALSLFGGASTQSGGQVSGGLARQMRRDVEQVAARTEIAAVTEQAQAFLVSQAMTNVATLVTQAEAHMRVAPAGAPYYEALITGYALSAGQRISRSFS